MALEDRVWNCLVHGYGTEYIIVMANSCVNALSKFETIMNEMFDINIDTVSGLHYSTNSNTIEINNWRYSWGYD